MKERASGEHARSAVTGEVIKMKVKKTSEDKQVCVIEFCCFSKARFSAAFSPEGHQPQTTIAVFEQYLNYYM